MSERQELRLEVDSRATPIVGHLRLASGEPLAFTGYVELVAALERLLSQALAEDEPAPPSGPQKAG